MRDSWDVVIVGAGPAGLSAALILGRCCRSVLVCDRGTPRSWASKAMHGFITRDGMPPQEFAQLARSELARYQNVELHHFEVEDARAVDDGFEVTLAQTVVRARKVLIATGVMDQLPPVEGLQELFGVSVFQCPYCDGWEYRGRPVAVYGQRRRGLEMARSLTAWTHDILLCTDGPSGFDADELRHLQRNGIRLQEQRVVRLRSVDGALQAVEFADGSTAPCAALFFDMPSHGQSRLTEKLGCRFNRHGGIVCGKYEATSVPGVYVAGNVLRNVQLSIVAAGEGASAAFGINRALTREDFERRTTGLQHVEHTAPPAEAGQQAQ